MAQTKKKARPKTRNLEKTRAEILKVTFEEVFKRGFQGVSIDDIVAKTKMTKGALYHQFPTKLELGYALVDEVIKPKIIQRWIDPLREMDNPLKGILDQMQKLIGNSDPQDLRFGCPLNNLVQEMSAIDKGFKSRLQEALNLWIDETEIQLKRAQKNGKLKTEVNTRDLARFIVMAHEGFYGLMKGLEEPGAFKSLFSSLQSYFKTISSA